MLEITAPFQTMKSIQELSNPALLVDSAHLNISLEDFWQKCYYYCIAEHYRISQLLGTNRIARALGHTHVTQTSTLRSRHP